VAKLTYKDISDFSSSITGDTALGGAALTGGLLAGAGYLASPYLARLVNATPFGDRRPLTPEEERKIRRRSALIGGLLGAGLWLPPMIKHGPLTKLSSVKRSEYVPFSQSRDLIVQDPFLSSDQKATLTNVLFRASDSANLSGGYGTRRGLLSIDDVADGAVGAGLGWGSGRLLGGLLALPSRTKRKLSLTGGLAGLLLGTGVIS
jgi:hypothetical protein